MDLQAFLFQKFQDVRDPFSFIFRHHAFHPVQRPAQVHRRRACRVKVILLSAEFPQEPVIVRRFDPERQTVDPASGADADGRRAPDLQPVDGRPYLLRRGQRKIFRPVRKLRLTTAVPSSLNRTLRMWVTCPISVGILLISLLLYSFVF